MHEHAQTHTRTVTRTNTHASVQEPTIYDDGILHVPYSRGHCRSMHALAMRIIASAATVLLLLLPIDIELRDPSSRCPRHRCAAAAAAAAADAAPQRSVAR